MNVRMGSPLQSEPTLSVPREIGRGTILDRWRLPDGTLYLDNAATRPMLPEVAEEMARLMANNPLNASSQHKYGQKAARMLEDARNFFKSELNVPSTGELIFNSGATEGLNMLLKSAFFADPTKNHIVTVKTEHKAVLNTCAYLETIGAEVTYLDVDEWGQVSVSDIEAAIRPTTCAVCVMWVNNETGVVLDIASISELCARFGVLLVSDLTQGVGKYDLDYQLPSAFAGVFSAHKFGGPNGMGCVFWKDTNPLPSAAGGGQEFDYRSGTQDVASISGAAMAYSLFNRYSAVELQQAATVLENLFASVELGKLTSLARVDSAYILNFTELRSDFGPFCVRNNLIVSRGSACHGGQIGASHVFKILYPGQNVWRISL